MPILTNKPSLKTMPTVFYSGYEQVFDVSAYDQSEVTQTARDKNIPPDIESSYPPVITDAISYAFDIQDEIDALVEVLYKNPDGSVREWFYTDENGWAILDGSIVKDIARLRMLINIMLLLAIVQKAKEGLAQAVDAIMNPQVYTNNEDRDKSLKQLIDSNKLISKNINEMMESTLETVDEINRAVYEERRSAINEEHGKPSTFLSILFGLVGNPTGATNIKDANVAREMASLEQERSLIQKQNFNAAMEYIRIGMGNGGAEGDGFMNELRQIENRILGLVDQDAIYTSAGNNGFGGQYMDMNKNLVVAISKALNTINTLRTICLMIEKARDQIRRNILETNLEVKMSGSSKSWMAALTILADGYSFLKSSLVIVINRINECQQSHNNMIEELYKYREGKALSGVAWVPLGLADPLVLNLMPQNSFTPSILNMDEVSRLINSWGLPSFNGTSDSGFFGELDRMEQELFSEITYENLRHETSDKFEDLDYERMNSILRRFNSINQLRELIVMALQTKQDIASNVLSILYGVQGASNNAETVNIVRSANEVMETGIRLQLDTVQKEIKEHNKQREHEIKVEKSWKAVKSAVWSLLIMAAMAAIMIPTFGLGSAAIPVAIGIFSSSISIGQIIENISFMRRHEPDPEPYPDDVFYGGLALSSGDFDAICQAAIDMIGNQSLIYTNDNLGAVMMDPVVRMRARQRMHEAFVREIIKMTLLSAKQTIINIVLSGLGVSVQSNVSTGLYLLSRAYFFYGESLGYKAALVNSNVMSFNEYLRWQKDLKDAYINIAISTVGMFLNAFGPAFGGDAATVMSIISTVINQGSSTYFLIQSTRDSLKEIGDLENARKAIILWFEQELSRLDKDSPYYEIRRREIEAAYQNMSKEIWLTDAGRGFYAANLDQLAERKQAINEVYNIWRNIIEVLSAKQKIAASVSGNSLPDDYSEESVGSVKQYLNSIVEEIYEYWDKYAGRMNEITEIQRQLTAQIITYAVDTVFNVNSVVKALDSKKEGFLDFLDTLFGKSAGARTASSVLVSFLRQMVPMALGEIANLLIFGVSSDIAAARRSANQTVTGDTAADAVGRAEEQRLDASYRLAFAQMQNKEIGHRNEVWSQFASQINQLTFSLVKDTITTYIKEKDAEARRERAERRQRRTGRLLGGFLIVLALPVLPALGGLLLTGLGAWLMAKPMDKLANKIANYVIKGIVMLLRIISAIVVFFPVFGQLVALILNAIALAIDIIHSAIVGGGKAALKAFVTGLPALVAGAVAVAAAPATAAANASGAAGSGAGTAAGAGTEAANTAASAAANSGSQATSVSTNAAGNGSSTATTGMETAVNNVVAPAAESGTTTTLPGSTNTVDGSATQAPNGPEPAQDVATNTQAAGSEVAVPASSLPATSPPGISAPTGSEAATGANVAAEGGRMSAETAKIIKMIANLVGLLVNMIYGAIEDGWKGAVMPLVTFVVGHGIARGIEEISKSVMESTKAGMESIKETIQQLKAAATALDDSNPSKAQILSNIAELEERLEKMAELSEQMKTISDKAGERNVPALSDLRAGIANQMNEVALLCENTAKVIQDIEGSFKPAELSKIMIQLRKSMELAEKIAYNNNIESVAGDAGWLKNEGKLLMNKLSYIPEAAYTQADIAREIQGFLLNILFTESMPHILKGLGIDEDNKFAAALASTAIQNAVSIMSSQFVVPQIVKDNNGMINPYIIAKVLDKQNPAQAMDRAEMIYSELMSQGFVSSTDKGIIQGIGKITSSYVESVSRLPQNIDARNPVVMETAMRNSEMLCLSANIDKSDVVNAYIALEQQISESAKYAPEFRPMNKQQFADALATNVVMKSLENAVIAHVMDKMNIKDPSLRAFAEGVFSDVMHKAVNALVTRSFSVNDIKEIVSNAIDRAVSAAVEKVFNEAVKQRFGKNNERDPLHELADEQFSWDLGQIQRAILTSGLYGRAKQSLLGETVRPASARLEQLGVICADVPEELAVVILRSGVVTQALNSLQKSVGGVIVMELSAHPTHYNHTTNTILINVEAARGALSAGTNKEKMEALWPVFHEIGHAVQDKLNISSASPSMSRAKSEEFADRFAKKCVEGIKKGPSENSIDRMVNEVIAGRMSVGELEPADMIRAAEGDPKISAEEFSALMPSQPKEVMEAIFKDASKDILEFRPDISTSLSEMRDLPLEDRIRIEVIALAAEAGHTISFVENSETDQAKIPSGQHRMTNTGAENSTLFAVNTKPPDAEPINSAKTQISSSLPNIQTLARDIRNGAFKGGMTENIMDVNEQLAMLLGNIKNSDAQIEGDKSESKMGFDNGKKDDATEDLRKNIALISGIIQNDNSNNDMMLDLSEKMRLLNQLMAKVSVGRDNGMRAQNNALDNKTREIAEDNVRKNMAGIQSPVNTGQKDGCAVEHSSRPIESAAADDSANAGEEKVFNEKELQQIKAEVALFKFSNVSNEDMSVLAMAIGIKNRARGAEKMSGEGKDAESQMNALRKPMEQVLVKLENRLEKPEDKARAKELAAKVRGMKSGNAEEMVEVLREIRVLAGRTAIPAKILKEITRMLEQAELSVSSVGENKRSKETAERVIRLAEQGKMEEAVQVVMMRPKMADRVIRIIGAVIENDKRIRPEKRDAMIELMTLLKKTSSHSIQALNIQKAADKVLARINGISQTNQKSCIEPDGGSSRGVNKLSARDAGNDVTKDLLMLLDSNPKKAVDAVERMMLLSNSALNQKYYSIAASAASVLAELSQELRKRRKRVDNTAPRSPEAHRILEKTDKFFFEMTKSPSLRSLVFSSEANAARNILKSIPEDVLANALQDLPKSNAKEILNKMQTEQSERVNHMASESAKEASIHSQSEVVQKAQMIDMKTIERRLVLEIAGQAIDTILEQRMDPEQVAGFVVNFDENVIAEIISSLESDDALRVLAFIVKRVGKEKAKKMLSKLKNVDIIDKLADGDVCEPPADAGKLEETAQTIS